MFAVIANGDIVTTEETHAGDGKWWEYLLGS